MYDGYAGSYIDVLTLCMLLNFLAVLFSDFFSKLTMVSKKSFRNIFSIKPFWIQIRPDVLIWVQTVYQQTILINRVN